MKSVTVKTAFAALVSIGAACAGVTPSLALPGVDRGVATAQAETAGAEQARWACGPFRCWWRPNYYGYGWGSGGYGWGGGWGWRWRPRPYWW